MKNLDEDLLQTATERLVAEYAWESRYPNDLAETYPTREEFDEALVHAQPIYDFVLSPLPTEPTP